MPTPRKGESEQEYVNRCVPVRKKEHPDESNDRSVAACYGMYRQWKKKQKKK